MGGGDWPSEDIPDGDTIFRRVHYQYAPDGELQPGAFVVDDAPAISTNWQKYCPTALDSKSKGRQPDSPAFGVISFISGSIRELPLTVTHTPSRADRSHTTVGGERNPEIREKLKRLARWEIRPVESAAKITKVKHRKKK